MSEQLGSSFSRRGESSISSLSYSFNWPRMEMVLGKRLCISKRVRLIHGCHACNLCLERKDKKCGSGKDLFNGVFEKMAAVVAVRRGGAIHAFDT